MPFLRIVYLLITQIILLSFCSISFAQLHPDQYNITFLTTQEGLSQATNFSMLQDSKGYMWIGSQDGINRYDGKRFFTFPDSVYFKGCKAPKQIFGIVEDAKGNIWMGTRGALYQYDQHKNQFQKIELPQNQQSQNSRVIPFALIGDEIWFLKDNLSFMAIHQSSRKIRILYDVNVRPAVIDPFLMVALADNHNVIWMANGNRLYEINPEDKSLKYYDLSADHTKAGDNLTIKELSMHRQSGVMALASDKGVILFDTKQKVQKPINDPRKMVVGVDTWYVKDGEDFFWVSNENGYLIKLSLDGSRSEKIFDNTVLDNDVHRGSAISCIYIDKWGRLWLNAIGEYIAIIDFTKKFMRKIAVGKQGGLQSGTIHSITVSDSVLWVSDTYLNKINRSSGNIEKIFSAQKDLKVDGFFRQIYFDSVQQRLWFNTHSDLWYYSIKNQHFRKTQFGQNGNPSVDYIRNFISLPDQKLLLARVDGVFNINRKDGSAVLLPALGNHNINHLCNLSKKRFALSVAGEPLRIFEYRDDLSIQFKQSIDLGSTLLMTVEDSARNTLWAASEKGLYQLDNRTFDVLHHYSKVDGMANDFIYAAIPDRFGWVWCSTNKGIVAVNGTTHEIRNFDKDPNLQSLEFNNRAFASDKDGYIYFGGVKGLNYFKPPFVDADTILPRLVIEEIILHNSPYQIGINPDEIQTVEFEYSPVPISFKVQALHLLKSGLLTIVYRIKGQQDWTEINNGEYIHMFNLSPGNYVLEINYREGNKLSSTAARQISINVIPPFYRQWWFLTMLSALALLLVFYLVNRRQRRKFEQLRKENEIMKLKAEQQIAIAKERERIITDLHDDVGATLSSMHIYGDLANESLESRPQESREMIGKISSTSRELMSKMGDIIWSMKPAGQESHSLEARLRNYSNELLTPKNILCDVDIDNQLAASVTDPEARKALLMISKEAINNIAKYSEASEVSISLMTGDDHLLLSVSDNGKGFDMGRAQPGNGLGNMQKRCAQLGGQCIIMSAPGKGTKITCKIPIASISHSG